MGRANGGAENHHNNTQSTSGDLLHPPQLVDAGGGHKRSLSGSILSRLSFFRLSSDQLPALTKDLNKTSTKHQSSDARPEDDRPVGASLMQANNRNHKGSLRKKALLGTGKARMDDRVRRSTLAESSSLSPNLSTENGGKNSLSQSIEENVQFDDESDEDDEGDADSNPAKSGDVTPRRYSQHNISALVGLSEESWSTSVLGTSKTSSGPLTSKHETIEGRVSSELVSPIRSSFSSAASNPYASTTDDDDALMLSRSISNSIHTANVPKSATSSSAQSSGGYFDISPQSYSGSTPMLRRRISHKSHPHSPSIAHAPVSRLEDEWDYSETEWWGWAVLFITWIVFVVGMGSCFGVWSWAWDVGETPYAPPELEDDPTLPIVGYYPALIVMTAVMAWVWVVVAWVGMKYFRHAKVVGD